ncbi:MDR family MFS transporter [Paenibacillus sp. sptzw28]|uniref:MDR family MFS transporter n=1 Tax=Paenibacillus sp. sptzw28 TaxID=715179 RepID=UPI002163E1A0|nr:MDR family MFS transporter [Paenibacillus sp. sptzw28]
MSIEQPKAGLITSALLMGLVLSSIDQTIVSTAMPTVINKLNGLNLYSWVFTVYMLASTTTMPIYGKMADLFGRRRIYMTGLTLFLIGSALCGFAGNMTELIVFRGIQGLGAGALMPVAFAIVADIYPPGKIGKFQGLFGAVFAISSICGPTVGGFVVEYLNWGWIFFINLPIGIPALFIVGMALKESKSHEKRIIDWSGAITLCAAVVSLLLALVMAGSGDGAHYAWESPQITGLLGSGAVFLTLFLWIETKAKEPIVPLRLFKIRTIAFGNIAGFFVSAGLFGAIAYIPLYVQGVIGVSPSVAGYILTPLMLSTVITSNAGGRLMGKASYRTILVPSIAMMAAGFILLSQMTADTTIFEIVLYLIITGLGMGAVYPTLGTAAITAVDTHNRGTASSSSQFFRSIGGTIGVSVFGWLLTRRMSGTDTQALLDSGRRAALTGEALLTLENLFSRSLAQLFLLGAVFVGISLIASILLGNARLIKPQRNASQDEAV